MKLILAILVLSLGGITGCAINPVTGKQNFALVSESDEIEQGRKYHKQIVAAYGVYDDPELQAYVDRVGQTLAAKSHRAHLKFTFTVLDSPEINAFALPGGYIYITRGIMAYLNSEAELAGVLGHEIGHVTARHSVRQQAGQLATNVLGILIAATTGDSGLAEISQTIGTGIVRGYGRDHELEADKLGAQYLHNCGYNPETMLEVIGVLKDQEVYERALAKREQREPNIYHGVFSTHPRNDQRLQTVIRAAKKLPAGEYRSDNQDLYHARIDGMAWGPSVKQGVVVDNRFAHPELAIALDLPSGWQVSNRPEYLQARDNKTGAMLQLSVEVRNDDESLSAFLRRLTKNKQLAVSEESFGVSARTRVRPRGGEYQPARVSAIGLEGNQVLLLLGTAGAKQFDKIDPELRRVSNSFRRLSPAEAEAITGPSVQVVERGSRTFASMAKRSAIEYDAESILRLLNRAFPDGDIADFDKVKTVVVDD